MTPQVTEHAMFRYLERTGRIDLAAVKAEMLTPVVVAAIKLGARSIKHNGVTFVLDRGKVITVMEGSHIVKRIGAAK